MYLANILDNKFVSEFIKPLLENAGLKIVQGIVAIIVGYIILKCLLWLLKKILYRSVIDNTSVTFILSILKAILYLVYIFVVASVFGVPMSSMVAAVAASGLAIALALKDSISSVANGVLIVLTKPFKEGDYVQIDGIEGTVSAIHMVNTILTTFDNKRVVMPNNKASNAVVVNFSAKKQRRLDVVISASYKADVDLVLETLREIANKQNTILDDPAPNIRLNNHGASALEYKCKLWVNAENFWDAKFTFLEEVVRVFNKKGIEIPYNQLDVYLKRDNI